MHRKMVRETLQRFFIVIKKKKNGVNHVFFRDNKGTKAVSPV